MRRLSKAGGIVWVVALATGLLGVNIRGEQAAAKPAGKPIPSPVAPTPQSIVAGRATYRQYCRFCHGESGKGDGKMAPKDSSPADLTDAAWDHGSTDAEIFRVIADGVPPSFVMKGFKSRLTATEIWNVVNYLRSLNATPVTR